MDNKFKLIVFTTLIAGSYQGLMAQTVQLLTSGTKTSIRGLSAVDDRVIWVSGSNGMVGKSIDSGTTFKWMTVKGFEKTDFRDIEAFDENSAVIMGIADPAYILKTSDGGDTWKTVYENKTKGMFLDAMEFWNKDSGTVVGDPIDGKFFIAHTYDGGNNWTSVDPQNTPVADSGEACFASSGTNISMLSGQEAVFVSGGLHSSLFISHKKIPLPIIQGKQSTGANSIAVKNKQVMLVVGGDFTAKDSTGKNCFITIDAGKTWIAPATPPHGYRSCAAWLGKKIWITCGLNGVDISSDEGNNWKWISNESFNVCSKAKKGKTVFFAGGGGRIGMLHN